MKEQYQLGVTGPLQFELEANGREARLIREFVVITPTKEKIVIPDGFVTDFASVPRIFWRIIPPWGEYSPAAVVHDYLYLVGTLKRGVVDKIFLQIMTQLGVSLWKRQVMYIAVRIAGSRGWNRYRKNESK